MRRFPHTDFIKARSVPQNMDQVEMINNASYADLGEYHYRSFVKYLADNYKNYPNRYDARMHNIFNSKRYFLDKDARVRDYYKTRMENTPFTSVISYILEYQPGGFLKPHLDPEGRITLVTSLRDEDLVGGQSFVYKNVNVPTSLVKNKGYTDEELTEASGENAWTQHENSCPIIIPTKLHETYAIGERRQHSVARIEQGTRTVLVEWWYYDERPKDSKEKGKEIYE